VQVQDLKDQLAERAESHIGSISGEGGTLTDMKHLNQLAHEISINVDERINLQKDLFELEDMNVKNRFTIAMLEAKAQVRSAVLVAMLAGLLRQVSLPSLVGHCIVHVLSAAQSDDVWSDRIVSGWQV
jgi:hypothetical protein